MGILEWFSQVFFIQQQEKDSEGKCQQISWLDLHHRVGGFPWLFSTNKNDSCSLFPKIRVVKLVYHIGDLRI